MKYNVKIAKKLAVKHLAIIFEMIVKGRKSKIDLDDRVKLCETHRQRYYELNEKAKEIKIPKPRKRRAIYSNSSSGVKRRALSSMRWNNVR